MIQLRPIEPSDNVELASIIRKSLESAGLNIPGTVYTDPTTDHLYELFRTPGSFYFVALEDGKILGGCGIFPTEGLPQGYAELVKLYLREEVRGKGIGRKLMEKSMEWAKAAGYTYLYLETFTELSSAVGLYRSLGFKDLTGPMGESGHHACQVWMKVTL
jgi:putative acetyltransferase